MKNDLIISKQFDEFFKLNRRFISIDSDINLPQNISNIISYLEGNKLYYQISSKRFIKVEWIIDRMNDYLENEGYYIDESIAEEILREISKTKSINRKNLKKTFFSKVSLITRYELNLLRHNISSTHRRMMHKNTFSYELLEDIESNFYKHVSNEEVSNYNIENNISKIYEKHKYINKKGDKYALIKLSENVNFKDIRELCQFTRLANIQIYISDVLTIMGLKRVGIHKIEKANSKYDLVTLNFQDSLLQMKNRMKTRDWDCYYNYTIDKKFTLEELGNIFDISRERVRQIVNMANMIANEYKYFFIPFRDYLDGILKYIDSVSVEKLKNSHLVHFSQSKEKLELELNLLNNLFSTNYHIYENKVFNFDINNLKEVLLSEILVDDSRDYKVLNKKQLLNYIRAINFKYPLDTYNYIISLFDNIIIDNEQEFMLIKKSRVINIDICRWILVNIGEPVHYSVIHEKYCQYIGNNMSLQSILATLDRSEEQGIIRTFTGTYGLIELGAQKHTFTKDIVIRVLGEFNRPMHYTEIIREVQKESEAKDNTIYANLNNSAELLSNNEGVYALEIWKDKLDEAFLIKRENERILINHDYNKYNNYVIKYLITDNVLKDYTLRLPTNLPIDLQSITRIINSNNEEFLIKYNSKLNYLSGFDRVLNFSNIKNGEYIYIEVISSDYLKVYKDYEYNKYLEGILSFGIVEESYNIEEGEVVDLLSIFFKDV